MDRLLPLGDQSIAFTKGETIDLSLSGDLVSRIVNGLASTPTVADLTRYDVLTTQLSVDAALALNIPIGTVNAKYSRRIFIQEFIKYTDIEDGTQKVRYGIGLRWVLNVKLSEASLDLKSIPMIAASAEMGYVEATALFQVIGIQSPKINALLAAPSRLTLDSYFEMNQSFNAIKALVDLPETTLTPQILAVLGTAPDDDDGVYEEAIAAAWALTKIAAKKPLENALDVNKTPRFKETVKSVYVNITGTGLINVKPESIAIVRAEKLLDGMEMDD